MGRKLGIKSQQHSRQHCGQVHAQLGQYVPLSHGIPLRESQMILVPESRARKAYATVAYYYTPSSGECMTKRHLPAL
jgi:hypothetical protein